MYVFFVYKGVPIKTIEERNKERAEQLKTLKVNECFDIS